MPDSFNRMFITDLDGTLLRSDGTFSHRDILSLDALKKKGVVRVIATGRSIYSFKKAVDIHLPVDYLIFSTGVGVMDYLKESIIRSVHIESDDRDHAIRTLLEMDLDFMVHDPVPDNHHFAYHDTGKANPDFFRRIDRYREFARPMNRGEQIARNPSQLLAVVDNASGDTLLNSLRLTLPTLTVIRSTSPLDHVSTWIEIFHGQVSKSRSAAWLANRLNILPQSVVAVGNDYNDMDLLEWASVGMVVENAPEDLKSRFPVVASNNRCGVSEAIEKMMAMR
jgi:hypothetical protein